MIITLGSYVIGYSGKAAFGRSHMMAALTDFDESVAAKGRKHT